MNSFLLKKIAKTVKLGHNRTQERLAPEHSKKRIDEEQHNWKICCGELRESEIDGNVDIYAKEGMFKYDFVHKNRNRDIRFL